MVRQTDTATDAMSLSVEIVEQRPPPMSPQLVHGCVAPEPPTQLENPVLELTATLQTTLDIHALIDTFARELRRHVDVDGLVYENAALGIRVDFEDDALHRASYDVVVGREQLGELRVMRGQPFAARELERIENFLCALVYPLRNALTYRLAVERAFRDPLTGALNRGALDEALQREAEVARRQGTPLALLMIDIDHFKAINDTHGHRYGDDVLRAVAHTLNDTIRRSDGLYRYGGEEFVVVASHTQPVGAQQLAERLRCNVDSIATVAGRPLRVTVSVGVAGLQPGESPEALFQRADRALYRAKANGRNRVDSDEVTAAAAAC